jgi:hypothetical protein
MLAGSPTGSILCEVNDGLGRENREATQVGRRIVMLHSFVKKTNRTPPRELETALNRMKEVKHGHA